MLCLVPFVAWFEDWMFVRKFKVLSFYWYIPVEVVGKCISTGGISRNFLVCSTQATFKSHLLIVMITLIIMNLHFHMIMLKAE